jgi:hypothetical protein
MEAIVIDYLTGSLPWPFREDVTTMCLLTSTLSVIPSHRYETAANTVVAVRLRCGVFCLGMDSSCAEHCDAGVDSLDRWGSPDLLPEVQHQPNTPGSEVCWQRWPRGGH